MALEGCIGNRVVPSVAASMKCLLPQKHGLVVGSSESWERNSVLSLIGASELTRF